MKNSDKIKAKEKNEKYLPVIHPDHLFVNRELSWLEFNDRVLFEARNHKNPLLERAKFLAITASNLDEFYVIRVASLKEMVTAKYHHPDRSGLNPLQQLHWIGIKAQQSITLQYSTYNRSLLPAFKKENIFLLDYKELDKGAKTKADDYFLSTLYPILTPMAVDASRPFPLIYSKSINLCVLALPPEDLTIKASSEENSAFLTLQIPSVVPRFFYIIQGGKHIFVSIEQIIQGNLEKLLAGSKIIASSFYRIMRNADLDIDEDEVEDLLKQIQQQIKKRQWGEIIRLEVDDKIDPKLLKKLKKSLEIDKQDIFKIAGPLDLSFLMKLYATLETVFSPLTYVEYQGQPAAMMDMEENLFDQIRQKDRLVHHPYESFASVIQFVKAAAEDPKVLAIKQTLYRVSSRSPIIRYLAQAAENGKQVMVLVELKARFDEENNIQWAKMLEKAGCHVIYGVVGLKTHSKITLVVRNDEDRIRRYLHLGTGNYNDITANIYTDLGLFTCSEPFGVDGSEFFNMLSGFSEPAQWRRLIPAPLWLRAYLKSLIRQEITNAKAGKKAKIIAKMNSLVDGEIIELFYEASQAGVEIDLIVRGICCLRPGMEGISDNITVRSITGRFLEHSRIYYFYNEGFEKIFLASADLMPRNLDKRIELFFPVEDEACKLELKTIINLELGDTIRSHMMLSDGTYQKIDLRGKNKQDSQFLLRKRALEQASKIIKEKEAQKTILFQPVEGV